MESLSRPPHRRKHSTSTNAFSSSSFSLKSPYDDIVFSKVGGKDKFGVHEYAEIFSGSSSIPVLDLSGLDEGVGSGDERSSKLDYSNIFGGLRDDDVGVPFEQLFSAAAVKKSNKRISEDAKPPSQESLSLNSPGKMKRPSSDASGQSTDDVKQHFNMSFNKTNQRNIDASNGKTHIAQLHAVPGFTYFVDGAPRSQKTEVGGHVSSLKREVSRTWSFSAGVEAVKVNAGSCLEKSHVPDKSHNANEMNVKSHIPKVPSPSSYPPSNTTDNKDTGRSRLPDFASKEAPEKTRVPSFDEELDENSAAAVSAAALEKAIEQAQESIRLAKMIMERKKEGFQDGSKHQSKSRMKVEEKRSRVDDKAEGETYERFDPKFHIFTGAEKKIAPSLHHEEKLVNAGNSEVERVRENVEAATEHVDVFTEVDKIDPTCCLNQNIHIAEKVELDNVRQNVKAAEACTAEGVDQEKESSCQSQVPGVFAEVGGHDSNTTQRLQELQSEPEQWKETVDDIRSPENINEMLENVPKSLLKQEEIVRETDESLMINQKDKIIGEPNGVNNDMGKCNEKFVEHDDLAVLRLAQGVLEQENMEKKSDIDAVWKEFSDEIGMRQEEAHLWFEIEEQLKEPLADEISDRELEIFTEMEGVGVNPEPEIDDEKLNYGHDADGHKIFTEVEINHEPEIDSEKMNYGHDADGQKLPLEIEQHENAATPDDISEFEVAETVQMEEKSSAEQVSYDAEETNGAIREEDTSEENQEAASEKDMDGHGSDTSTVFSEPQEPYDDLDCKADEYNEENANLAGKSEIISTVEEETVNEFHLEADEMCEADRLHRSASEEIFVGRNLNDAFEDIAAEYGELTKDKDTSITDSEIHAGAGEYDAKMNTQTSPEADHLRPVFEQTLESNEGSVSTSDLETEGCAEENVMDKSDVTSDEREHVDKQSEEVYSQERSEDHKETDDMTSEREVETGQNTKKCIEEIGGTSSMEQKDARVNDPNEQQQRIEAIKRGREREKDRIAVERAIREARERAFAEARERAERAAVERAAAEARQRVMAEAREKASIETKQAVEKASIEAKLRAERAAVERATVEARERAFEKAKSQKTFTEAKIQSESSTLKHSFSSSDLDKFNGTISESAQRRKARLERHQRIMERAAKALEEKNMRDLLAQKEQAERNRLAESLDADIKRWATGKEGNLRALLSTLQYILGAESGWQPISLTEIITTAAVKKAYRKATLCVHPDKLQQRGATIHQKYICEKVFDLLKAAWNRFNSEER